MDIARVDQLRRVLRENPDYHRQLHFACGTTACAAGWAIALEHGAQVGNALEQIINHATTITLTPALEQEWEFSPFEDDQDCACDVAMYARMLLDFSPDEARAVFYDTTDADTPEVDTVALLDAFVHRKRDELTNADIEILNRYELPLELSNEVVTQ